jgi:hypothetical protein
VYGVLVVLVILFMPDGILGFVRKLVAPRAAGAAAGPEPSSPGSEEAKA